VFFPCQINHIPNDSESIDGLETLPTVSLFTFIPNILDTSHNHHIVIYNNIITYCCCSQHYLDSVRTSLMASLPVHQGKEVHILILVKTSKAKIHAQPNNLQQSLGETSRVKRKINICSVVDLLIYNIFLNTQLPYVALPHMLILVQLISYVAIPKPSFNFKDFDEIKQRGVRPDMLIG
jgi:hypothetical protein